MGHLTGLQARVKELTPNTLFTHCLAHRLNLALQHGCSISAKCRIFFTNLTGIATYFYNLYQNCLSDTPCDIQTFLFNPLPTTFFHCLPLITTQILN